MARKFSGTVPRSSPITMQCQRRLSSATTASMSANGMRRYAPCAARQALRDDEEPHQAQHMVDPDRAGIAHGRAQHLAERLEVASRQDRADCTRSGPNPGPAGLNWSGGAPTDRPAQHYVLVHPGIGAAGIDADRGVEIEPDRQSALRERCRGSLRAGARRSIAGIRESRFRRGRLSRNWRSTSSSGLRHSSRPSRHAPASVPRNVSNAAKRFERAAALALDRLSKSARRAALPLAAKFRYAARNAREFQRCDGG